MVQLFAGSETQGCAEFWFSCPSPVALQLTADTSKWNKSIENKKCQLGISLVDLVKESIAVQVRNSDL